MTKAKISVVIFLIIILYAVLSQVIISNITDEISGRLYAVRANASAGDYYTADALYEELLKFYNSKEIYLEIFVKRDVINNLSISLNSISAYINPENLADLQIEIDKAGAHAKALDEHFSSLF